MAYALMVLLSGITKEILLAIKFMWQLQKSNGTQLNLLKSPNRKGKNMKFTEVQQTYLKQNPVEAALTMPITWDYADSYLNGDEVSNFIQNWVESLDPAIKETAQKRAKKDPKFFYKKLKAQEFALIFAKKQKFLQAGFEPKFQGIGKGIILWEIEQGSGTYDEALKVAILHDLYTVSNPIILCKDGYITGARAGWDLQARKQIGDFSLDLYGDDRGWGEGAYFLVLTYNNAEANKVFELENCGI